MTAEYGFERKTIILLVGSIFILLILVFSLGLLIGLGVDRNDEASQKKITRNSEIKPVEIEQGVHVKQEKNESILAKETESKPVSPGFSETAPTAEIPKISQPKKE